MVATLKADIDGATGKGDLTALFAFSTDADLAPLALLLRRAVPEVLEGSLMLAAHSLLLLGVPLNRVLARIRAIREERYSLFRGFFRGATDATDDAAALPLATIRADNLDEL